MWCAWGVQRFSAPVPCLPGCVVSYAEFLERKTQFGADHGFEPVVMPDHLFDFQKALVEWAVRKGRARTC